MHRRRVACLVKNVGLDSTMLILDNNHALSVTKATIPTQQEGLLIVTYVWLELTLLLKDPRFASSVRKELQAIRGRSNALHVLMESMPL